MPVRSFPPLHEADARVLVLGTMPGVASLAAVRYYAHPRNAFWPVAMALATGHAPRREAALALDYASRCRLILAAGFAVWDVLASCVREGSLDTAIRGDSIRVNTLDALVADSPELVAIAFNGRAAETLYRRHAATRVAEVLETMDRRLELVALPSTSPAMARLTLEAKHRLWHDALAGFLHDPGRSATAARPIA